MESQEHDDETPKNQKRSLKNTLTDNSFRQLLALYRARVYERYYPLEPTLGTNTIR